MTQSVYNWLQERWYKDNVKKYHYLFDMWVSNITPSQVAGYRKQMYNDINNVLR